MLLRSVHSSKSVAAPLAPGVLRKTEAGAFQIDGHTLLKGCRLHPGHAVWAEDISALASVLAELEQNKDELSRKNELESEMRKTELPVQTAMCLYDSFEAAVEAALPDIRFVFLRIKAEGERIRKLLGV